MRLWSVHPEQLDRVALIAVWREGLLAKKVLEGNTRGYRHHPQLDRFKQTDDPLLAINCYLYIVADEADRRGYHFDRNKLMPYKPAPHIEVTDGQLGHEWRHLLNKCALRSPNHHSSIVSTEPKPHPLFKLVSGPVAPWEKQANTDNT